MIKDIVKDTAILTQKSEPVSIEEAQEVITDLLDTANHHIDECAGLAAPQIGVHKKVIVVRTGNSFFPMVNPVVRPDYLVKGGDYTFDTIVGAKFVSSYGGNVITIPLVENFSSSSIIKRL